jgi:YesN/AraC family two-component response regulator
MLIEDEEIIRDGLQTLLEDVIGDFLVCCEANNGEEALEKLGITQPDIIITDIRMEKMGGIETIKYIREKNSNLPIIIISGYDDFSYVKSALKYQVSDYLLKPVDRIELKQTLDSITAKLAPELPSFNEERDDNHIIRQVKDIVKTHLHEEISLRNVAKQVYINHQYLSTLFKNETGMSFSKYIVNLRIEKAKKLLKDTNLKIYEISSLCGYMSTKQFTSVFKQVSGNTPSDYKNLSEYL